jgi:hypothetical protein
VVLEAEQLLAGDVVARRDRGAGIIRPWVLVNVLAHADRAGLLALQSRNEPVSSDSWIMTLGYLSSEITAAGPHERDLVSLQRRALVPLELGLLARQVAAPTSPAELARLVMGTLREHPINRDG